MACLATEAVEELNMAQTEMAQQLALCKSARDETDALMTETTPLKEQSMAESVELLHLKGKHFELTDEMVLIKLQNAANDGHRNIGFKVGRESM